MRRPSGSPVLGARGPPRRSIVSKARGQGFRVVAAVEVLLVMFSNGICSRRTRFFSPHRLRRDPSRAGDGVERQFQAKQTPVPATPR